MSYRLFLLMIFLLGPTVAFQRRNSVEPMNGVRMKKHFDNVRSDQSEIGTISKHFISTAVPVTSSQLVLESHHQVPAPASSQPSHLTFASSAAGRVSAPLPQNDGHLNRLASAVQANPILAALLISSLLGANKNIASGRQIAYNSPAHEPPNPFVALLLSNYGRYIPRPGFPTGLGLYSYNAANNIHNTKPFGSYKIYEDSQ